MLFSKLMDKLTNARMTHLGDPTITGIAYDSRKVQAGNVFIAMKGGSFDGHSFIGTALSNGAAAVVAEVETPEILASGVPCVIVPNGRVAMGEMAAAFYDYPSRKMKLVGVTGTSGKTTVTHLIQTIFGAAGQKAGLIGTLGVKIGDRQMEPGHHTTPESLDLQRTLAAMADDGVKVVAMEVSSHGLYQGRSLGCEFDCGVFTNIARDHLDFHGTVDAYFDAKMILFREYPARSEKPFTAAINADDSRADQMRADLTGSVIAFGVDQPADLKAENVLVTDRSVAFDMSYQGKTVPVRLGIGGYFNVYNALSAAAAALALGLDLSNIAAGLAEAYCVPGRFESVDCGQDFGVLVDYAHTPDELENVLSAARKLASKRLIAVFGCGGDRDRGKRPIMGRIGDELADLIVITSDNPRTEEPSSIIEEILRGIPNPDKTRVIVRPDRKEAIREAIALAESGDLIVIAGKGHEDYQIFADRTIHFDDREVARELLSELK